MPDNRQHNPGEEADVEYPYNGNDGLIRYYSELGYIVIQNETGNEYGEAIDPYPSKYTYTISENKIEPDDNHIEPEEPEEFDTSNSSPNLDHVTLINGKPFDYKED